MPDTMAAGPGIARFSNTGTASFHSASASKTASQPSPAAAGLSPFQKWVAKNKELKDKIQALGIAGVAAYGLFNTLYYTFAFLFVWLYVAKVPSGLGLAKAAQMSAQVGDTSSTAARCCAADCDRPGPRSCCFRLALN